LRKRYLCPRHREATPSVVLYGDRGYCFGCSQNIPLEEIGVSAEEATREAEYVEDIGATLAYVDTLPRKEIRGFQLPFNERGYYLVYPCRTYYKFRVLGAEKGAKYRGPAGHKKPPFEVVTGHHSRLVLVEGEFNALSLATVEPECDIVSPGGAGDFYSKGADKHYLTYSKRYETIYLVVDNDAAGAQAAIEAKSKLMALGCSDVRINLVTKDFNDVHTQDGKQTLEAEAQRMGLLRGMRRE
jgi:hypothetical protein